MTHLLSSTALWLPGVLAMACLVIASGFFSASETALFYLSRDELRRLRLGKPRERLVGDLLLDPDRLLTTLLFGNLIINLTYFAVSIVLAQRLAAHGHTAAAGLFGIASLFGIIVFGEIFPKSLAVALRMKLAPLMTWPLMICVRVVDPVTGALQHITRVVRRAFWPHIVAETYLNVEDLERAVAATELSEDVLRQERQLLHNILDISEINVEEVMRPRGTYLAMPQPIELDELTSEIHSADYLVIQEHRSQDIERVVPLNSLSHVPTHHLEEAAEPVQQVPWCANLASTLQLLRDRFSNVAAVINEYGDTIGIVTYEDLMDAVLATDPTAAAQLLHREHVLEVAPGSYHIDGITTLRYLCRRLGLDYEPVADGVVTVGGILQDAVEHIPEVGDECTWKGYRLRVIDVPKPGQMRVLLTSE